MPCETYSLCRCFQGHGATELEASQEKACVPFEEPLSSESHEIVGVLEAVRADIDDLITGAVSVLTASFSESFLVIVDISRVVRVEEGECEEEASALTRDKFPIWTMFDNWGEVGDRLGG